MWDKLKQNIVVIVITIFIWMAADQNVREEQTFRIAARLVSRESDRYAAIAEPPYQVVLDMTVAGRRRQLKEFADVLASKAVFEAYVDESKE